MSLKGNAGSANELTGNVVSAGNVGGSVSVPKIIHGQTPYIKDGNWWIGEVDTGVKAEGVDGQDGVDGKDGYTPQKGVDYFDGQDGSDGADGFSPTIETMEFDGGTTVSITDKNGTQSFDVFNGERGANGTSVTITDTIQTDDDSERGVLFSDGTMLFIKNGIDGQDGADGAKGDKGDPYTLTDADKTAIAEEVLSMIPDGNEVAY